MLARNADPGSIPGRGNIVFFAIRIHYLQILICHSTLLRFENANKLQKFVKLLVNLTCDITAIV